MTPAPADSKATAITSSVATLTVPVPSASIGDAAPRPARPPGLGRVQGPPQPAASRRRRYPRRSLPAAGHSAGSGRRRGRGPGGPHPLPAATASGSATAGSSSAKSSTRDRAMAGWPARSAPSTSRPSTAATAPATSSATTPSPSPRRLGRGPPGWRTSQLSAPTATACCTEATRRQR